MGAAATTGKVIPHNRYSRRARHNSKLERQKMVGQAIRDARIRAELTQGGLGKLLAPILGHKVPQTTVSRWEIGSVSVDLEQLRAIEFALQLVPGTLFANSGYCESQFKPKDVENAIRSDKALEESLRDTVVTMYRAAVTLSRKVKDSSHGRRQQTA